MKLTITRDQLLKPLQQVSGVVEKRQTLPVLSNVLMVVENGSLALTGTDLEVELVARQGLEGEFSDGEITVPARKLLDYVKSLPANAELDLRLDNQKLMVKAGSKSRSSFSTLPAGEFPNLEENVGNFSFTIAKAALKRLIDKTAFAMAQQDVRYYLNGMLFEVTSGRLRAVSTDGHRLAMCDVEAQAQLDGKMQVIVPRKGVLELSRLLADVEGDVTITLGSNHVRVAATNLTFTSKLIDGKFPDYERVLPKNGDKLVLANRDELRQSLSRAAIFSNEKFRGVRLILSDGVLRILANNPDQDEADESVDVEYSGASLEIGFNVSYLLDVLNVLDGANTSVTLGDSNSSALVHEPEKTDAVYVVMPMRL